MGEMTLSKLITYILIFLFLGLFIYSMWSSEGFFNKIAKSALNAEKIVGMEPSTEVKATPLPENVIRGRESILSSLDLASQQQKTSCILPQTIDLSKLGDYAGEIVQTDAGITFTILDPKSTGDVRFSSEQKSGVKICIINPQSFYDCFLKDNFRCSQTLRPTDYTKQSVYRISQDTIMRYLVKTPTGEVCIFPMEKTAINFFCGARDTGLDDSCEDKLSTALPSCSSMGQITTNTAST